MPDPVLARFLREVVEPAIAARWPGMDWAAGRLGTGSDVLGHDDEMSRDHDWGLRLTVLVPDADTAEVARHLERRVPLEFEGMPTSWTPSGAEHPRPVVEVTSLQAWTRDRLGVDPEGVWSTSDWLSLTGQAVLETVGAGEPLRDSAGFAALRRRLAWYPDEVWRWALAAAWLALGDELPFVGRAGARGDDLGSRVIAARLARVAMHLGFLLERTWPPYAKWLGTAFARLPLAPAVGTALERSLSAGTWQERERGLAEAIRALADVQRGLDLPIVEPAVVPFFDRPFLGVAPIHDALLAGIRDPELTARPLTGVIDQWAVGVPGLVSADWRRDRA